MGVSQNCTLVFENAEDKKRFLEILVDSFDGEVCTLDWGHEDLDDARYIYVENMESFEEEEETEKPVPAQSTHEQGINPDDFEDEIDAVIARLSKK